MVPRARWEWMQGSLVMAGVSLSSYLANFPHLQNKPETHLPARGKEGETEIRYSDKITSAITNER